MLRRPDAPTSGADVRPAGRLDWVDTGRGMAIVLVALFHTSNWLVGAGIEARGWQEANEVVSSLRMPLFFALSGLFAAKWVRGTWRPLWEHKLRLFAWVFLVWGAIGSVTYFAGLRVRGMGSVLNAVVLPYLVSPVVPRLELWFIWALGLFFVVARLTRRVPPAVQLGVAAVASAVALSGWQTLSPGWSGSVRYYAFFLAGLYGRDLLLRLGSTPRRGLLVGVFVAWAAVAVGLWALDARDVLGLYFVNCVLGVAAGIGLSRLLAGSRSMRALGARTLPVYVAHTPLAIVASIVLSATTAVGSPVAAVVAPPLLAAVVVLASLGLHRWAQARGAGWLYAPPAWFDLPRRTAAPHEPVRAG